MQPDYRTAICEYIRANANPPEKFSHQPRLYQLACRLAGERPYDDDVLFAAAWFHDLGVFIGHRPEDPVELANWDHVAYVCLEGPRLLEHFGFPPWKIPAVLEVIRTHLPSVEPTCFEGALLREADILEQLGAVSILRTVCKIGRDTRFTLFSDALRVLKQNAEALPGKLRLDAGRSLAQPRVKVLEDFLTAAEEEAGGVDW